MVLLGLADGVKDIGALISGCYHELRHQERRGTEERRGDGEWDLSMPFPPNVYMQEFNTLTTQVFY